MNLAGLVISAQKNLSSIFLNDTNTAGDFKSLQAYYTMGSVSQSHSRYIWGLTVIEPYHSRGNDCRDSSYGVFMVLTQGCYVDIILYNS